MSPPARDAVSELRPTSGLINVIKSLTGIKSSRTQNSQSHTATHQYISESSGIRHRTHRELPDYKSLFEQLKPGNPLATRISAADALRYTVQLLPVSGVSFISIAQHKSTNNILR